MISLVHEHLSLGTHIRSPCKKEYNVLSLFEWGMQHLSTKLMAISRTGTKNVVARITSYKSRFYVEGNDYHKSVNITNGCDLDAI